jgi:hypothetical protein
MSDSRKSDLPLHRAAMDLNRALYASPSNLRAFDGRAYTKFIGRGLFSHLTYNKNERIIKYIGNVKPREEFDRLTQDSDPCRANYALHITNTRVLDCYEHYKVSSYFYYLIQYIYYFFTFFCI